MANYFLDTSALAKHYHAEKGTPEVERILAKPGSTHYLSRLGAVEIQSVFALKVRTNVITAADFQLIQKHIATDFSAGRFLIVKMLPVHFADAEQLIRKYSATSALRTLDSLQLAVALYLSGQGKLNYFVCADSTLAKVAEAEGLSVINPAEM